MSISLSNLWLHEMQNIQIWNVLFCSKHSKDTCRTLRKWDWTFFLKMSLYSVNIIHNVLESTLTSFSLSSNSHPILPDLIWTDQKWTYQNRIKFVCVKQISQFYSTKKKERNCRLQSTSGCSGHYNCVQNDT